MAQIKIKRGSGVPSGLTHGELAYDVANRRLYVGVTGASILLANTDGGVSSFNGLTGAVTGVTTGNENTFQVLQSFAAGISASGGGTLSNGTYNFSNLKMNTVGGDEGGQIDFGLPAGSSLSTAVAFDIFQNKVRIFETGGTNRGVYIDLAGVSAGVGTNLVGGGGGAVSSVSGSGNGILVSPTTGAVVVQNTGVHSVNGVTGTVTNIAVTNSAQTFTGTQSFTNGISAAGSTFSGLVTSASGFSGPLTGNATTATTATNINLTNTNANATFYPVLAGACGSTLAFVDAVTSPFTYNPSTRILTVGNLSASAGANTTTYAQDSITENNLIGFSISSGGGINIDSQASSTTIGDIGGLNNSTTLSVNDATLTVETNGSLLVTGSANIYTGLGITGNARINGNLTVTSGICAAGISSGSYILTSSGIKALTGTTYTFLAADNGDVLTMNNASPITVTVPSGLPVGYSVTVIQIGAGQVSFSASGTTINSYQSYTKIAGQHGSASLVSYSSNVFNLAGSLSA